MDNHPKTYICPAGSDTIPPSAIAVAASSGRKVSIVTSASVTSVAVPKTVVVERSDSTPAPVSSSSGRAMPAQGARGSARHGRAA